MNDKKQGSSLPADGAAVPMQRHAREKVQVLGDDLKRSLQHLSGTTNRLRANLSQRIDKGTAYSQEQSPVTGDVRILEVRGLLLFNRLQSVRLRLGFLRCSVLGVVVRLHGRFEQRALVLNR